MKIRQMLTRRVTGLLAALFLFVGAPAMAADWYAAPGGGGSDCTQAAPCTIQGAIDKAGANDTVHVAAGTYSTGNPGININKQGLTLVGDNSPFAVDPHTAPGTMNNHSGAARSLLQTSTTNSSTGNSRHMIRVNGVQNVTIRNLYFAHDLRGAREAILATGNVDGLVIENNYIKFQGGTGSNRFGISVNPEAGAGMAQSVSFSPASGSFVTLRNNVLEPTITSGGIFSPHIAPKRAILFNRSVGLIEGNQMAANTTDLWVYQIAAAGGSTAAERRTFTLRGNWFFGRLQAQVMSTSGSNVTEVVIEDNLLRLNLQVQHPEPKVLRCPEPTIT